MSPHVHERAGRRDALIARCETQRRQLAEASQALKPVSHIFDAALVVTGYLRAHPLLAGTAVAAATIASRGRLLRWLVTALPIVSAGVRIFASLRKP